MKKLLLLLSCIAIIQNTIAQLPTLEWAKQMKSTSANANNEGVSVALDVAGNVYTTGYFIGNADFDPGAGTFNLTSNDSGTLYNTFISKLDANGNFIWAKNIGGTNYAQPTDILLDPLGNIYVTGFFVDTVDFNPGSGAFYLTADSGTTDVFILKLSPEGNFIWAKNMGGNSGYNYCSSITIDPLYNIYIAGNFTNTVDFDPGADTFNVAAIGGADIFISKLDSAGNFAWVKTMGGINSASNGASSVIADAAGNVYSTGWYQDTVDFDPGAGTENFIATGGYNSFILKLDTNGNFIWAKNIAGTDYITGTSIVQDPDGNTYATGYFVGTVDFDPGAGVANIINSGFYNLFILKLDPAGNYVWAKTITGEGYNIGLSIACDVNSNIYTTGHFNKPVDFDPGAGTYTLETNINTVDMYVLKLNSGGNFVWAVDTHGSEDYPSNSSAIAVDAEGNVFTTGYFRGTVNFDPGVDTFNLDCPVSRSDIFVEKLNHTLTGITENTINTFSVYPNPVTDRLALNFDATEVTTSIEIKNMLGQTVYSAVLKNGTGKQSRIVDVSVLDKGVYFIQLTTNNSISSKKFIKD